MKALVTLGLLILLAGCATTSPNEVTVEEAAARAYVPAGPPKLTLFTVINNTTGQGGHTALMVSGSQQVIFDPAGSFQHPLVAERGDVLYGMSPAWVQAYKSAHARSTYHVVSQEIAVTHAQAARALQLVQQNGAVGSAFCAHSTASILRQVPGFEGIETTFYPVRLMRQLEQRPDVVTDRYYENDAGDVRDGIRAAQE
ncbi:hypothetical protein [uncultured Roseobacter sp.]|uniref:hypothetical protein n=1 Tax=uncultured Roseobacter sp. TaxID=114847 RepID=UPI00260D378F|nr:hypothetical protein [uncultured Roseobacter sp.]